LDTELGCARHEIDEDLFWLYLFQNNCFEQSYGDGKFGFYIASAIAKGVEILYVQETENYFQKALKMRLIDFIKCIQI
jgi:hypothetical protein